MKSIEELREFFKNDIFATEAGCVIEDIGADFAKCSMKITDKHKNARGAVMGGAIFTLADFTFAVLANSGERCAVSLSASTSFLKAAKGDTLTANASFTHNGKSTCCATVTVCDNLGTSVALLTVTGIYIS
ncbi:MAG: PaaI family thioesterase [Clostridia bacterium]|nr:PaaI family thioesterase [Clostridia bacterium]